MATKRSRYSSRPTEKTVTDIGDGNRYSAAISAAKRARAEADPYPTNTEIAVLHERVLIGHPGAVEALIERLLPLLTTVVQRAFPTTSDDVIVNAVEDALLEYSPTADRLRSSQWPANAAPREARLYNPGDVLEELPNIELSPDKMSVLLFVNSTCRYCTESMPFYRQIAERGIPAGVELIAMSREAESTLNSYLDRHGLRPTRAVSLPANADSKFRMTPTLVVVSPQRVVEAAWVGQLDPQNQKRFFTIIGVG